MYKHTSMSWVKHIDFVLLDLLSLFISLFLAYLIRKPMPGHIFSSPMYRALVLGYMAADFLIILALASMKSVLKRGYLIEFGYTIKNAAVLYAVAALIMYALKVGNTFSRLYTGISGILYVVISYTFRILYKQFYMKVVVPREGRSLLIVTTSAKAEEIEKHLEGRNFGAYRLAGLVLTDGGKYCSKCSIPVVAVKDELFDYVRLNWVDEILLVLPYNDELSEISNTFMSMGITVHIGIEYLRELFAGDSYTLEKVGGFSVLSVSWNSMGMFQAFLKRLLDIIGGFIGCILTLVLTVIIGPAIFIKSPGPIFFSQERIGRNGKKFHMYKFRSMYMDAEERKAELMKQNRIESGLMFKLDFDPRIIGNKELPDGTKKTGIGQFIRNTSLDEFPQFFNVLIGQMSLVGTRPPSYDEWIKYEDHHRARMAMKPGITGLWQISGRSDITDFEEIVKLDTKYIAEWSLALDIKILFKTILVVLKREGSM